jgi:hypothetical protein
VDLAEKYEDGDVDEEAEDEPDEAPDEDDAAEEETPQPKVQLQKKPISNQNGTKPQEQAPAQPEPIDPKELEEARTLLQSLGVDEQDLEEMTDEEIILLAREYKENLSNEPAELVPRGSIA